MKEELLHYLWRTKRFLPQDLATTKGIPIQINDFGKYNHHAGPDFLEAKIKIGETLWAGNVEIHLKSSDWMAHQHQTDRAYDNVILHVVFEEDQAVLRQSGQAIPCLELRKRIPPKIIKIYQKMMYNERWIPCQHHFHRVSDITKNLWLDRLLVERLEQKTVHIKAQLEANKNAWEVTFYQVLARNFGLKVNAATFEALAKSIPLKIFGKHKNNLFQIEALLFGQAGFLDGTYQDVYPLALQKEYLFLQKKYNLQPLRKEEWQFMRLRPANFPTIRIAQFATLIKESTHLFSKILEIEDIKSLEKLFKIALSDYWETHYLFDKTSATRKKTLGKSTIHLLFINTIIPFLFLYGTRKSIKAYRDRAIRFLEAIPAEKNNIISQWKNLGLKPDSAYQSQALLQLKNEYCNAKRCLDCVIGNSILK